MKISDKTKQILSNFVNINQNVFLREGDFLTSRHPEDIMFGYAIIEEKFPKEVPIYDGGKFLSVFGIFKDEPELEFGENSVSFTSGKQSVNYVYSDPSVMTDIPSKKPKVGDNKICEFQVTAAQLATVNKAAGCLDLSDVAVVGDKDVVSLQVLDVKDPTTDTFKVELVNKEDSAKYRIIFKIEQLNLIPGDYDVELYLIRQTKDATCVVAHLSHTTLDVEYFLTSDAKSKYQAE